MLSVRSFARSAPRALNRMASLRQPVAAVRSSSLLKPTTSTSSSSSLLSSVRPAAASFSTTVTRRAGQTDEELSAKLADEAAVEEEMVADSQEPTGIKDFLASSPFELIDSPGKETVKLVRKYNDEEVTVSFSIADLAFDPYDQDPALEDEEHFDDETNMQNSNKQSHVQSTGGARSAPAEEEIDEETDEDLDEPAQPINMNILIQKPGKSEGAMSIDVTARDGNIAVEGFMFFEDGKLAAAEDPESSVKRADAFAGPPFESLDEDLQVLVERYLEERGVTQALAVFAPSYLDHKEQKEYIRWLGSVKAFVDA